MPILKIIIILIAIYVLVGCGFAGIHIIALKNMIKSLSDKKAFYEDMIKMHGTSSSGAEYYVALQELIIANKEAFDELELMKKSMWKWYFEMTIPFLIAWPHLKIVENKIGRD